MSPHQDLAARLVSVIDSWDAKPSGFAVARVYSVEQYVGKLPSETPGMICVLASGVESERQRSTDIDDITIGVVYLANLANIDLATCDTHDTHVDNLRTLLRKQQIVTLASGQGCHRRSTGLPTPYDSERLRQNEFFAAVIATTYHIGIEVVA